MTDAGKQAWPLGGQAAADAITKSPTQGGGVGDRETVKALIERLAISRDMICMDRRLSADRVLLTGDDLDAILSALQAAPSEGSPTDLELATWALEEAYGRIVELEGMIRARGPSEGGEPLVGWRPIETAPKDGTPIIALTKRGEVSKVWWFLFEEGWDWQDDHDSEQQPTHWMPLPAAPAPDAIRGGEAS